MRTYKRKKYIHYHCRGMFLLLALTQNEARAGMSTSEVAAQCTSTIYSLWIAASNIDTNIP